MSFCRTTPIERTHLKEMIEALGECWTPSHELNQICRIVRRVPVIKLYIGPPRKNKDTNQLYSHDDDS